MKRKFMCTLLCIALTTSMISSSVLAAELPKVSDESETAVVAEEIVDDTMTDVSEEMVETGTVDSSEETLETDTVDSSEETLETDTVDSLEEPVEEPAEESDVATETAEEEEILLDDEEEGFSLEAKAVPVDEAHFPDEEFRRCISERFDSDKDGILSVEEINKATSIKYQNGNIESLKGIGYLTELKDVDLYHNKISYANFSKNTKLSQLQISSNQLTSLDLSANSKLMILTCHTNKLETITFHKDAPLWRVAIENNPLTELDLSGSKDILTTLYCNNTKIESLDLSQNTGLDSLYISQCTELKELDISNCKVLRYFQCIDNKKLSKLSLPTDSNLKKVHVQNNALTSLDVSGWKNLEELNCSSNEIRNLAVKDLEVLKVLLCYDNNMEELRLDNLPKLQKLNCQKNNLKELCLYQTGVDGSDWKWILPQNGDNKLLFYATEEQIRSAVEAGADWRAWLPCELKKPEVKTDITNQGVTLSWDKVPAAQGYKVMRYVSGAWKVLATVTDSCEWTDETVAYGKKYSYLVRPFAKVQGKDLVAESSDKITLYYLKTPKLTIVANTYGGVKLSWGAVSGATNYGIYRKAEGSDFQKVGESKTNSFVDTEALSSDVTYTYTIQCISEDGTGCYSEMDKVGKMVHYLASPKVTVVRNTTSGVRVCWEMVTGATYYRVYYKEEGGSWNKCEDTTSEKILIKGLQEGKKYYFGVKSFTEDMKTSSGYDTKDTYLVHELQKSLPAPTLKTVSNAKSGAKVTWDSVAGAESYRVYRKEGTGSWTKIATVTGTTYTDKKAVSGVTYSYTVCCVTADGLDATSKYNTKGLAITYLSQPMVSSVTFDDRGGVSVKWDKVAGAVNYRIYRKTDDGNFKKLAETTKGSYRDTTVAFGKTYTYSVCCISADGTEKLTDYDKTGKSILYMTFISDETLNKEN